MLRTAPAFRSAPALVNEAPAAPREFRAAWVATVANIDWPSRKGLSSAEQQAEMLAILDRAVALRLNAIILQIRTSADALYPSKLEPWSEYLSGKGSLPSLFMTHLRCGLHRPMRAGWSSTHGLTRSGPARAKPAPRLRRPTLARSIRPG
jgi:hypothetical protein